MWMWGSNIFILAVSEARAHGPECFHNLLWGLRHQAQIRWNGAARRAAFARVRFRHAPELRRATGSETFDTPDGHAREERFEHHLIEVVIGEVASGIRVFASDRL